MKSDFGWRSEIRYCWDKIKWQTRTRNEQTNSDMGQNQNSWSAHSRGFTCVFNQSELKKKKTEQEINMCRSWCWVRTWKITHVQKKIFKLNQNHTLVWRLNRKNVQVEGLQFIFYWKKKSKPNTTQPKKTSRINSFMFSFCSSSSYTSTSFYF